VGAALVGAIAERNQARDQRDRALAFAREYEDMLAGANREIDSLAAGYEGEDDA
jgi:hypothetical protein